MTDRINALTVVLEKDTRSDDVEVLVSAIRLMRNVVSVETNVVMSDDYIAETRARTHLIRIFTHMVSSSATLEDIADRLERAYGKH